MSLEDKVKNIVADKLGVEEDKVVLSASFMNDLDADSLDLVELIMAFEEEFSTDDSPVEISDEDAENITTVQKALDFLTKKGISWKIIFFINIINLWINGNFRLNSLSFIHKSKNLRCYGCNKEFYRISK